VKGKNILREILRFGHRCIARDLAGVVVDAEKISLCGDLLHVSRLYKIQTCGRHHLLTDEIIDNICRVMTTIDRISEPAIPHAVTVTIRVVVGSAGGGWYGEIEI